MRSSSSTSVMLPFFGLGTLVLGATPPAAAQDAAPPSTSIAADTPSAAALAPSTDGTPPSPEPPGAPPPPADGETQLPPWLDDFSVGGGLILYYYQPTSGDGDNNVSVFFANLLLDGQWGVFGLHVEPRFRDGRLRPFFEGPAWLQEAYATAELGPVTVKVGKTYKRLGLFWDNSFYGNVQVYDGLKLDPNYGASVEGSLGEGLGVDFSAQYFVVDGRTNVSLAGRDTLSVPAARRRNAFVGRVAPRLSFSGVGSLQVGVSAERFTADLPGGEETVTRLAAEAKLTLAGAGLWAEYLSQSGRHVTDFPYAAADGASGRASADNGYVLLGAEYAIGPVTLRYNVSFSEYSDLDVSEVMHVPAIGVRLAESLGVLAEVVNWQRDAPEGGSTVDESVNVTVSGWF